MHKDHKINQALTNKYQGCGVLFAIAKLNISGKLVYSYCLEFGKYVKSDKIKLTLDKDYKVKAVYDIVYLETKVK